MDNSILHVLMDPVVLIFVCCTLVALIGKFLRSWIISCVMIILSAFVIIVIIITIGQLTGLEEQIRYYITAHYSFFSSITLTLRDIILMVVIILAFQIALALHITKADVEFQKRFFLLPKQQIFHYEMEYTFEALSKKLKGK